jgi:hypothetical protein
VRGYPSCLAKTAASKSTIDKIGDVSTDFAGRACRTLLNDESKA